jgi:hypothetical protein
MTEFVDAPGLVEAGVLTVAEKDGRQRLVVDARPANCFFRDPPRAALPTGAAFGLQRCEPSGNLFSAV